MIILFLSYLLYRSNDEANEREEALQTARRFAIHMSSINHSTLDRDIQEIRSVSTTSFHQEFDKATGGSSYHDSVRELEATSTGKILSALIDSIEAESAQAVVIVQVTSHNKTFQRPKTENRKMEISLRRTAIGWKVDHLVSAISTAP